MIRKGLYRPEDPAPSPAATVATTYGGNAPAYIMPQTTPAPQALPATAYYPMPQMQPQCCPRPKTCIRELDRCGLNGIDSATYDPTGVTADFSNDETVTVPVLEKGSETQYGESTGIVPYYVGGKGAFTKIVQFIDKEGNPLVGAHLTWKEGGTTVGTTTDSNGEATVNVASESTQITTTYVGKRTHIATFANLGNMITLQENVNNLPPVIVGQPTKPSTSTSTSTTTTQTTEKKSNVLRNVAIGVGLIFLVSALASGGKTGKANKAIGLAGTKSKKRKGKKAKNKKRKGLREPVAEVTL